VPVSAKTERLANRVARSKTLRLVAIDCLLSVVNIGLIFTLQ
jgi:hypothetical protein